MRTPKLEGGWAGRHVRLRVPLETKGGVIFPAGALMLVRRSYGGLELEAVRACPACRLRHRHFANRVDPSKVEVLPRELPLPEEPGEPQAMHLARRLLHLIETSGGAALFMHGNRQEYRELRGLVDELSQVED